MTQEKQTEIGNRIFICTVGGSPEPVRVSLTHHRPAYVVYVASPGTRDKIYDIEHDLEWKGIRDREIVNLSDYQDLLACVRDIHDGANRALQIWQAPGSGFLVDFTGGTKVMSAALVLAMTLVDVPVCFAYVGGDTRTKNGVGIVENGHEHIMRLDNPWEALAIRELHALAHAFRLGQFASALETVDLLAARQTRSGKFYTALREIVRAYASWDNFDYKTAAHLLQQGLNRLGVYDHARAFPRLCGLLDTFRRDQERLARIEEDARALRQKKTIPLEKGRGLDYVRDLVANAQRKAAQGHYDDAVARLYSAIEKMAKIALAWRGIDNSHVTPEDLAGLPAEFMATLAPNLDENGVAQIGLEKSYQLLCRLDGDAPLAKRYREHEKELGNALQVRNHSLLAHGYTPIDKKKYDALFAITLDFLEMDAADLPIFPELDWRGLLQCA